MRSIVPLGDLTEPERPITYGVVKPGPEQEDGVLFVRGGDVFGGRISVENLRTITPSVSAQYKRTLLRGGELLVSLVGNPGEVAIAPETLAEANIARQVGLVSLRPELNSRYVMYYLMSPVGRAELFTQTGGAVQQVINLGDLKRISVPVPERIIQDAIADILAAYDDLIENNRRRMALLEEAARQLYREWFVRLRFPGHEHTRIIDGVPEGWERKPLADCCNSIDYGYTASATTDDVGPKFLRITDIVPDVVNWSRVPHCEIEEGRLAKFRLVEGDIVIARTGATVGYAKRLHKSYPETVFASYLVRLRTKADVSNLMLGVYVESDAYKAYVHSRIGGAAQPNANAKVLSAVEVLVPTRQLQRAFDEVVEPIADQRELLQRKNDQLHTARDLLLPRLMSGEIAI